MGLTPVMFWQHKDELLAAAPGEIEKLAKSIVEDSEFSEKMPTVSTECCEKTASLVKPTTSIFIGVLAILNVLNPSEYDAVIVCSSKSDPEMEVRWKKKYVHLLCVDGKLGSRSLRTELPKMQVFLDRVGSFKKILFCCLTGKDLSVGCALVALCLYVDEDGILT